MAHVHELTKFVNNLHDDKDPKIRVVTRNLIAPGTVEALEVNEIDGIPTVTKSRVVDLATGGETISIFVNSKYNIGLKDDILTERYLRRAPKEVRR